MWKPFGRTTSTSAATRPTTTQPPDAPRLNPDDEDDQRSHSLTGDIREEIEELPQELAGARDAVLEDIETSAIGRAAIRGYVWMMDHAPTSTRGKVTFIIVLLLVALAPSFALLYLSVTAGQEATENWFGDLGYAGVFLANLAGSATLFIPVPALTAAAQALIVSTAGTLSPFWVGVLGGLGMAIGEITAYVAGMAAAVIAKEEEFKPPSRLQPAIDRLTRWIDWLMDRYGMPTLFVLAVIPNPIFEIAGWTAGATRYPFWKFMAALTPGKVLRGLILAYAGEQIFF